jgi:hypothetical protein
VLLSDPLRGNPINHAFHGSALRIVRPSATFHNAAYALSGRSRALCAARGQGFRLFEKLLTFYDDILDHCCCAWNKLIDMPWKIMSIGVREWAYRS